MSFADTMVTKYESLLQEAAGFQSVTVDGRIVTLAQLEEKYQYWKRLAARANGTRPRAAQIKLG